MRGSSSSWMTPRTSTPCVVGPGVLLPLGSLTFSKVSRSIGSKTTRSRLYGPPSGVLVASALARLLAMTSIRRRCAVSAEPEVFRISNIAVSLLGWGPLQDYAQNTDGPGDLCRAEATGLVGQKYGLEPVGGTCSRGHRDRGDAGRSWA